MQYRLITVFNVFFEKLGLDYNSVADIIMIPNIAGNFRGYKRSCFLLIKHVLRFIPTNLIPACMHVRKRLLFPKTSKGISAKVNTHEIYPLYGSSYS